MNVCQSFPTALFAKTLWVKTVLRALSADWRTTRKTAIGYLKTEPTITHVATEAARSMIFTSGSFFIRYESIAMVRTNVSIHKSETETSPMSLTRRSEITNVAIQIASLMNVHFIKPNAFAEFHNFGQFHCHPTAITHTNAAKATSKSVMAKGETVTTMSAMAIEE